MSALISAEALAESLARVCLLDVRASLSDPHWGLAQYALGHIADAEYLSLEFELSDLSKKATEGRHPLPNPQAFSLLTARLGLQCDSDIVIYDQDSGVYAARAWWLLRAAGFTRVRVLDGGLAAWLHISASLSTKRAQRPAVATPALRFTELPSRSFADVASLDSTKQRLLDARAEPRFAGREEAIDPVAGHIPGAINRPFSENLAQGRFKSPEQLRQEFVALLPVQASEVIHMCGSGVTACHNLMAMEHAGLHGSALFAPSWSGWISDPSRPIVRS
jgi:thiosulfate/3-mercaptopyruvate sulfurtransferase